MTSEEIAKNAKLIMGEIPAVEFESYVDMLFWLTKLELLEDLYNKEEGALYITGKHNNVWYMIGLDIGADGSIIRGKGLIILPLDDRQKLIAEAITRTYQTYVNEECHEKN